MRSIGKKILSVLLSLLIVSGIIGAGLSENGMLKITAEAVGNYGVNLNSAAYLGSNPYNNAGYYGQCTWYCWGRAYEKLGISLPVLGNATDWTNARNYGYIVDQNPSANSIMVEHYNPGHVLFVEKVENGYAYCTEGNYNGTNYHEDIINLSTYKRNGWSTSMNMPVEYIHLGQSHNPVGAFDSCTGNAGSVTITGWVLDEDDLTKSLEIHVYIGGSSINGEGHGGIIANISRKDVDSVHHCGEFHGFSATIETNLTGYQPVYVYGINIGGGENAQIGDPKYVNISAKQYTLIFNANGGNSPPANQTGNGNITLSSVKPIKDGYTFQGWATSSSATTAQYQPGATFNLTTNTTLYAVWKSNTPQTYTLTYNANGGTNPPAKQTGSGTITLSSTKPTRSGYTFQGWATSKTATTAKYQPGASFNLTANTTLYAVWKQNSTPDNPPASTPVIEIRNFKESRTEAYGASILFTAVTANAPSGSSVHWYYNGEDVGSSATFLMEYADSSYTVQAKLVDSGGNIIAESKQETVNIKTGFFAKLIAFFRSLFGLLPYIEQ